MRESRGQKIFSSTALHDHLFQGGRGQHETNGKRRLPPKRRERGEQGQINKASSLYQANSYSESQWAKKGKSQVDEKSGFGGRRNKSVKLKRLTGPSCVREFQK